MPRGKFIENAPRRVLRAVVDRDDFEMRIIQRGQRRERARKFFFFIARGKDQGNARALGVLRRCKISDPGNFRCAVGDAEPLEDPKGRDQGKKKESKNMHQNWYPALTSGYPNMQ